MTGPPLHRRYLLGGIGAAIASAAVPCSPTWAQVTPRLDMRGALDAEQEGIRPGSPDDQSAALQASLERAGAEGRPLFLPPGRYSISDLEAPSFTSLIGVPGESRLVFRGGAFLLRAQGVRSFRMERITVDGGSIPLAPDALGLVGCEMVPAVVVNDCEILDSGGAGLALRGCAGRVERTRFSQARTIGLYLSQSAGMLAADNVVSACGDTGILVERYEKGADDSIVRGNRVSDIKALSGGTGQYGNGINLVKANGVLVSDNRVDGCALSAIRCFSSDNLQIGGNITTESGETAIYVEFAHQGAVVTGNLVDGGAMGITFTNFDKGGRLAVCSGNLVRNIRGGRTWTDSPAEIGAGISADADIAISGNVIENALQGLELGWGEYFRNVLATGNVIRNCGTGIAVTVVEGTGPAVIADNLIAGSRRGAILGMRWLDVATPDLAVSGAADYPALTVERNRVT